MPVRALSVADTTSGMET